MIKKSCFKYVLPLVLWTNCSCLPEQVAHDYTCRIFNPDDSYVRIKLSALSMEEALQTARVARDKLLAMKTTACSGRV